VPPQTVGAIRRTTEPENLEHWTGLLKDETLTEANPLVHTARMDRRTLLHAGFALLLAFTQMDSVVHVVSHLADAGTGSSHTDKKLPHSKVCEKCLAFAAIGGAMPSTPLAVGDWAVVTLETRDQSITGHSEPYQAYASRAPPAFV
jgi:hypothetical protein